MPGLGRFGLPALVAVAVAFPSSARHVVPPDRSGRVVLDNFSSAAQVPPVPFDHWRHRAMFTCRLCHVDVGFAMEAGATKVSAATNRAGFHCGACHDGKKTHRGKPVFASCSESRELPAAGTCGRCHGAGDPARLQRDYEAFARDLPRKGIARGVDWEAAEAQGKVQPLDFMEGVSIARPPLAMDRDVVIPSKVGWMAEVRFSHKKHAVWNGCEACHPDIFPATKAGTAKHSMFQLSSGESCGVCHATVAFPMADCERCHVKPVR